MEPNIANFIQQQRKKGRPDSEIHNFLQQQGVLMPSQSQARSEQPGIFSRAKTAITEAFTQRGEGVGEGLQRQRAGEQTPFETGFQLAGQTAGFGFDVIGAGIVGLARMAPEQVKDIVGAGGQAFLQTSAAQAGIAALGEGVEAYQSWKEDNPRAAANLEAFGNIASAVPVGTSARATVGLTGRAGVPTTRAGQRLTRSADVAEAARRTERVTDIISPQIRKTKLPQGRALRDIQEGGITTQRRFAMESPIDQAVIKTVSEIPPQRISVGGVETVARVDRGSILSRGQAMESYIETQARNLEQLTKAQDVIFPKRELIAQLNNTADVLRKSPLLTGDAGKTADRVIKEYVRRINAADGKLSEVLKIRKDMDSWVKKFAGERAFSGERANALSLAVKELRNTTNEYLISRSPVGSQIRTSLERQFHTFKAIDNVTPKALAEAGSKVERLINTIAEKTGIRSKIVQGLALFTGVGTFGAMTAYAPVATAYFAATFGLGGLYKAAVAPTTRRQLGNLLSGIGEAAKRLPATDQSIVREGLNTLVGLGVITAKEAGLSAQEIASIEEEDEAEIQP
jgi:hypothetical protein